MSEVQSQPRVFALHYPPGASVVNGGEKMVDNSEIAQEVIRKVLASLEAGKSVGAAFPLQLPDWAGSSLAQWQLKEVQRIDEESYDQLVKVARTAAKFCETSEQAILTDRITLPLSYKARTHLKDLIKALHDAGYEWEELC